MTRGTKLKQGYNRLDAVSPEEMQEAMKLASLWLTYKLEGRTDRGPFSEVALGEPARLYFPKRAYMALKSGAWKWKKGLKLSTQLIRIMRSDMHHAIEAWKAQGEPEVVVASRIEPQVMGGGSVVKPDLELAEDLAAQAYQRKLGYEIAFAAVKDDPKLTLYVQLVRDLNDYRAIALKMRVSISEIKEMEKEIIELVSRGKP